MPLRLPSPSTPQAAEQVSATRGFALKLVTAVIVLNLFIGGMVGATLYQSLRQHEHQSEVLAENLSTVLQAHLSGIIAKIDVTLLAVADEIHRQEQAGGIDAAALEEVLRRHDARLPEALGLRVVDAQGIIRYGVSGIKVAQASIADRPQFIKMRDNPHIGLVISKPVLGRAAQTWMITLSRRLNHPDGSFAGDVHVAMELARLTQSFASIDVGPNGIVALWDDGPSTLARFPDLGEPGGVVAKAPKPSGKLRDIIESGGDRAAYRTASAIDNIDRQFFVTRLGDLPLWVNVGLAEDDYLIAWRRQATQLGLLTLLFCLATIVLAGTLYRGWRNRQRAADAIADARNQAEIAHRSLEMILGSAGEGICGLDTEGRITFINRAARRTLGWGDDEGVGLAFHDEAHHHREDGSEYPALACPVWQTLHDGQTRHVARDTHWRRDGSPVPVEFTAAPIIQAGAVVGGVILFRDITRRLKAESDALRNLAITTALGAILRHALDPRTLDEILGSALTEILSLPWLNLEERGCIFLAESGSGKLRLAAGRNLPLQITRQCAIIDVGHCLCGTAAARRDVVFSDCVDDQHVTTFAGMAEHGHYCVPILDGDDVLGVLNVYVSHQHQRDKEEERFLRLVSDTLAGIIKRKRVEQNLRDSEELSKTLMNATIDGAFLLDDSGTILAANQALATRFHTSAEEMVGTNFFDWLPPSLIESRRALMEQVFGNGEAIHAHDERDGMVLDNRIYPIRGSDGQVGRVAIFSRDVTQQRNAQRAVERAVADLARSNEELQQFAYVASHDLREPLRAITGHLQLLQRILKNNLDADAAESLHFAVDGAKRMDALIRDLLDYSRIGHTDRQMDDVDLGEVISESLANLSATIADSGARVQVGAPMPHIRGNRMELTRLFQNLIGNALKYRALDRAPEIEVSATPDHGEWVIAIKDNGIGIEPEYFDRIFMIFQRLHGRSQYEGTGIGLAVCRKIVERHGGRIWLTSEPQMGSTFFIALPVIPAAE
ncbi:MAG: PAS domain-containing protein [Magnetospirillum sp.]|nr:PAS domain-containing protein [Magnetospirillum sp.]